MGKCEKNKKTGTIFENAKYFLNHAVLIRVKGESRRKVKAGSNEHQNYNQGGQKTYIFSSFSIS